MSKTDQQDGNGLLSRAAKGIAWSGLGVASQRIVQTGVFVLLARILDPDDFGLIAIATLTINLIEKIKGMGMVSALIQRRSEVDKAADALFYFNLMAVLLVYGLIYFFAPQIASFFHTQDAALVLKVLSLQLFAEAGMTVPRSLAIKKFYFKKLTLINCCGSIGGGIISIVLAVNGCGVWALVYGMLGGAFLSMALWWWFSEWRPSRGCDYLVMKEMLGFGVRLSMADIFDGVVDSCNRLFVGRFLSIVPLGYYDVTTKIVQLPFRNIISAGHRVALPAFCELQNDRHGVRRWYLKMINYSSLIMAPLAVCLIMMAGYLVPVVFGEKWNAIVPYLRLLGAAVFFLPLLYTRSIYVSSGRADLLLKFTVMRVLVTLPMLYLASRVSLYAVCLVEILTLVVFSIANQWLVLTIIGLPVVDLLRSFEAPLAGSAMVALSLLVGNLLLNSLFAMSAMPTLIVLFLSAVAVYLGFLYFRYPDKIAEVKKIVDISVGR